MKTLKFLTVAALLAVSATASAQFTNSAKQQSASSSTDGWSTVWLEYNPSSFDPDKGDSQSFTGLSLGYSKAFPLSSSTPLFLEAGAGLQYSFYSEDGLIAVPYIDYYDYVEYYTFNGEEKFNMLSAKIPVNLIYKFDINNSSISLMPYIGANIRFNISGKMKYTADDSSVQSHIDNDDIQDEQNLFDKNDMGGSSLTWKRLQLGWNIGVKARFGESFLVGLSYGKDFSEISKKVKIGTATIGVGYTF